MLVARGSVTTELLLSAQDAHAHAQLRLNLDPAARCGAPKASSRALRTPCSPGSLGLRAASASSTSPRPQDVLADVPLYVHAKEVRLPDGSLDALELT